MRKLFLSGIDLRSTSAYAWQLHTVMAKRRHYLDGGVSTCVMVSDSTLLKFWACLLSAHSDDYYFNNALLSCAKPSMKDLLAPNFRSCDMCLTDIFLNVVYLKTVTGKLTQI